MNASTALHVAANLSHTSTIITSSRFSPFKVYLFLNSLALASKRVLHFIRTDDHFPQSILVHGRGAVSLGLPSRLTKDSPPRWELVCASAPGAENLPSRADSSSNSVANHSAGGRCYVTAPVTVWPITAQGAVLHDSSGWRRGQSEPKGAELRDRRVIQVLMNICKRTQLETWKQASAVWTGVTLGAVGSLALKATSCLK